MALHETQLYLTKEKTSTPVQLLPVVFYKHMSTDSNGNLTFVPNQSWDYLQWNNDRKKYFKKVPQPLPKSNFL